MCTAPYDIYHTLSVFTTALQLTSLSPTQPINTSPFGIKTLPLDFSLLFSAACMPSYTPAEDCFFLNKFHNTVLQRLLCVLTLLTLCSP